MEIEKALELEKWKYIDIQYTYIIYKSIDRWVKDRWIDIYVDRRIDI